MFFLKLTSSTLVEEGKINYRPANFISSTSCSQIRPSLIRNILIIRPGALGDVIVTLPALEAIRNHFSGAHIEIMGYLSFLEILNGRFYADSVSRFDRADIAHLFMENSTIPATLRKTLKGVDLIFSFVSDREHVLAKNLSLAGVGHVVHYEPFPADGEDIHITDHFLRCLDMLSIPYTNKIPRIVLKDEDIVFGEKFTNRNNVEPEKALVAIHPGSGSRQKCWPVERYAELISWLVAEMNAQILLVSGHADTEILGELTPKVKDVVTIADQLPLPYLAAVIKRCNFFVGNDSGITHLASAIGTPAIAIFGPTNPDIWGPRGKQVEIIYKKYPCSPCLPDTRRNCFSRACFGGVNVEDVTSRIKCPYTI